MRAGTRGRGGSAAPRGQRGMTLIELMIALVLGLTVVAAVFNVYAGTSKSQRFTAGLQSLQENGRFGLSALRRGFRLAGFSENRFFEPFGPVAAGAGDSTIVVRAERPFDCNGGDTSALAVEPGVAVNTYAHANVDGVGVVTCEGNASADGPVPLVENVDAFRVLYGEDTDADGVPNRFVTRPDVGSVGDVVALRFALLVNSGNVPVRSRARAETHAVLGENVPKADRRLREVFAATVKLRNR